MLASLAFSARSTKTASTAPKAVTAALSSRTFVGFEVTQFDATCMIRNTPTAEEIMMSEVTSPRERGNSELPVDVTNCKMPPAPVQPMVKPTHGTIHSCWMNTTASSAAVEMIG